MGISRRRFMGVAAASAVGAAAGGVAVGASAPEAAATSLDFYGRHQRGITDTRQQHTYFAAFDVTSESRSDLVALLRSWSDGAARMTSGEAVTDGDTGEALGLSPARLTVQFGFGRSLFGTEGRDRFGLAGSAPAPLIDLPPFTGDQLTSATNGGDLTVQVCAEDPQVAYHALRQLTRLAQGTAAVKWSQAGFISGPTAGGAPRNLLGFHDGTVNPAGAALDTAVWVGDEEGPAWMAGGSYLVVRRIRLDLDAWDKVSVPDQELIIGRQKASGALLDAPSITDAPGHVGRSAPANNWGAQILRRSYQYDNGPTDAGLLFFCYQRYPEVGFIAIFSKLALDDTLTNFTTHTASVLTAVPAGIRRPGDFIGQDLFDI